MPDVIHRTLAGAELHEPFHVVGATDPGPVGAGWYWLDTAPTPYVLRRRNAGNTAWVAIGAASATDPEVVRDTMAAALVAGANVTITPNDAADTITIAAAGGSAGPGEVIVVPSQQATPTVASTTSTTVWSEWLATTRVLPAGTWDVAVQCSGVYVATVATGGPELRIAAPIVGAGITYITAVNSRAAAFAVAQGSVVSDGVAATPFRAEYRRHPTQTGTVSAEGATLFAVCRRTA